MSFNPLKSLDFIKNSNLLFLIIQGVKHIEITEMLLSANADVNLRARYNETACIYAARSGYTKIVELLVEAGADIHIQDSTGRTAFKWALFSGHTKIAEILENPNLYKLQKKLNIDDNKTLVNSNIL